MRGERENQKEKGKRVKRKSEGKGKKGKEKIRRKKGEEKIRRKKENENGSGEMRRKGGDENRLILACRSGSRGIPTASSPCLSIGHCLDANESSTDKTDRHQEIGKQDTER